MVRFGVLQCQNPPSLTSERSSHAASSTDSSLARIPPILLKAGIWIPYFASSFFMLLISSSVGDGTEQKQHIQGPRWKNRKQKEKAGRLQGRTVPGRRLTVGFLKLPQTGKALTVTNDFHISSCSFWPQLLCLPCSPRSGFYGVNNSAVFKLSIELYKQRNIWNAYDDMVRLKMARVTEIEAETPSLTRERYFSIKILDLWSQAQLEQVQTVEIIENRKTQYEVNFIQKL